MLEAGEHAGTNCDVVHAVVSWVIAAVVVWIPPSERRRLRPHPRPHHHLHLYS